MTLHPVAVERLTRTRHRGPISAGDPRHGSDTGYAAGCRDACCREAHARQRRIERKVGGRPLVPALGTIRRVEALACLGWSTAEISRRVGRTRSWLLKVTLHDQVQVETALLVAGVYEDLCMTRCTTRTASRTAAAARAKGYVPPLGWQNIDNPDERPTTTVTGRYLDPVVVDRILNGDWRLHATHDERLEVLRRWATTGHTDNELEIRTGWNVARDLRPHLPREENAA